MNVPYLARGVMPVGTDSSVLVSSSKYLNNPRLRDWLATILLRKNGKDLPPPAEMHEFLQILGELRDFDKIEEQITAERKVNPQLDEWFSAGHISRYRIEDFAQYRPGSLGRIFYDQMTGGSYDIQIVPWSEPKTQLEFFNLRSGQTHDFEHILTGGGFNFMGELVPYWYRLTNVPRFIKDQKLASELNVINIFGSLRYQTRTALHYPEVWPVCVDCINRGITVGTRSDALFLARIEDAFHLPLEEARAYKQLIDQYGYTQQQLADSIGKSRSHIANTLRLQTLPDSVLTLIETGTLSAGHARTLVATDSPQELAEKIIKLGMTVRQAEDLTRTKTTKGKKGGSAEKDADTRAMEKAIRDALGLNVSLNHKGEGGQLVITYKNFDQLDEVFRRLTRG